VQLFFSLLDPDPFELRIGGCYERPCGADPLCSKRIPDGKFTRTSTFPDPMTSALLVVRSWIAQTVDDVQRWFSEAESARGLRAASPPIVIPSPDRVARHQNGARLRPISARYPVAPEQRQPATGPRSARHAGRR
jgi:hypothetical protein